MNKSLVILLTLLIPSIVSANCYVDQSNFASWLCRSGRAYSSWCSAPSRVGNFSSKSECERARQRNGDAAWLNRTRCVCTTTSSSVTSSSVTSSPVTSDSRPERESAIDPEEQAAREAAREAARQREEAEWRAKIIEQQKAMEEGYLNLRRREFETEKKNLLAKLDQRFGSLDRERKALNDLYCAYQLSMHAALSGDLGKARKLAGLPFDEDLPPGLSCPKPQIPLPEPTMGPAEEFRREALESALQELEVRTREMEALKEKKKAADLEAAKRKQEVKKLRAAKRRQSFSTGTGELNNLLSQAEEALKKAEAEATKAEEEYLKRDQEIRALDRITRNIIGTERKEGK